MIRYLSHRLRKNERGAAMVEFAFAVTLLLLIIFAIIDFAWILHGHITLTGAVREGVRLAVVSDLDDNDEEEIKDAVRAKVREHARTFSLSNDSDILIDFGDFKEETSVMVSEAELPLLVGWIPLVDNPYILRNVKATMMNE